MATTVFSYTWVVVFGFLATIYNLLLLCMKRQSCGLFFGTLLCWVVAVLQIVACATNVDESNLLSFCGNDVYRDSALCSETVYLALNGFGAFVWTVNGLTILALPDPEPHGIHGPVTVVPVPESHSENSAKRSAAVETVAHSEEPIPVSKGGGKFEEDCNVDNV